MLPRSVHHRRGLKPNTALLLSRLLLALIAAHALSSVLLVHRAVVALDEESEYLESIDYLKYRPSTYRFDRLLLVLFVLALLAVFAVGALGVHLLSQCMLLFHASTGCALYLLMLVLLNHNQLLGLASAYLLGFVSLATSALSFALVVHARDMRYSTFDV